MGNIARSASSLFLMVLVIVVSFGGMIVLFDKLKADINASKAQVRGAAALERIADILEGKK
mgnify:CR=1 FL=1